MWETEKEHALGSVLIQRRSVLVSDRVKTKKQHHATGILPLQKNSCQLHYSWYLLKYWAREARSDDELLLHTEGACVSMMTFAGK